MARRSLVDQATTLLASAHPSFEELVRAIHAINPTARGLTAARQAHRYALKAKLQSVLVERFGERLDVIEEADDLVALRVIGTGDDACHAQVSALDEEARRWVRWQLDVRSTPVVAPPALPPATVLVTSTAARDLVKQGHKYLEEYDFDQARVCFEQAMRNPSSAMGGAEGLLTLLVDHMASDEEALALEPHLPREARNTERVHLLLSVALLRARGGAAEVRAKVLDAATRLSTPRALDLMGDVAHAALDGHALDEAAALFARFPELRNDRWLRAVDRLTQLRAATRAPLEQALLSLVSSASDEAISSMAERVLAQWPDSRIARKVLTDLRARQQEAEILEALKQVQDWELRCEWDLAITVLRGVLERVKGEPRHETLLAHLRHLEREAHKTKVETVVQSVIASLPATSAFITYLTLSTEAAKLVRARTHHPLLVLLDALSPALTEISEQDVVSAAQAWADASLSWEAVPEEAFSRLAPFEAIFQAAPRSRRFLQRVGEAASTARRTRLAGRMAEARAALATLDVQTTREQLRELRGEPELKEESSALERQVDAIEADVLFIEKLSAAGNHPATRSLAQRHASTATEEWLRSAWQDRAERARLQARVAMRYELLERRIPLDTSMLPPLASDPRTACLLREGTSEIAISSRVGNRILCAMIDAETKEIVRRFMFDIPSAKTGLVTHATQEGIWFLYRDGCVFVDYDGEPRDLRFLDTADTHSELGELKQLMLSTDNHYLWLVYEDQTIVVDLQSNPTRTLRMAGTFRVMPCRGADVMICVHKKTGRVETRQSNTAMLFSMAPPYRWQILGAAAHPVQEGVVLLSRKENPEPGSSGLSLHALLSSGERRETRLRFSPEDGQARIAFATSKNHRLSFVAIERKGAALLMAVEPIDAVFRTAYYIDLPPRPMLIGDEKGARVFAFSGAPAVSLVELTASAPRRVPRSTRPDDKIDGNTCVSTAWLCEQARSPSQLHCRRRAQRPASAPHK